MPETRDSERGGGLTTAESAQADVTAAVRASSRRCRIIWILARVRGEVGVLTVKARDTHMARFP
jgi:hypothetical protein